MQYEFDKQEYEEWFTQNVEFIFGQTGIAHYNAQGSSYLRIIFAQDKFIKQLEQRVKELEIKSQPKKRGRPKKVKEQTNE